jgi:hypothetical protein
MALTFRRMLPADLAICCQHSNFWPTTVRTGHSENVYRFLLEMLLTDRMWGSIVEKPGEDEPVAFGGCIFIDDTLALKLERGEHQYLLTDLAVSPILQTHVLDFEQVKFENKRGLNFYGTVFRWPKLAHFHQGLDMLQASLLESMSGFNIKRHFKHIYPVGKVDGVLGSFAMRLGFGADVIAKYEDRDGSRRSGTPVLFGQKRDEILKTDGAKRFADRKRHLPVGQLLCRPAPILDLPYSLREVLRLEMEGVQKSKMEGHLQGASAAEKIWDNAIESLRKKGKLEDIVDPDNRDVSTRGQIKRYVERNRQELGVLPHLTQREKEEWLALSS